MQQSKLCFSFRLLLLYPWLLAPFGMPAPVSDAPPACSPRTASGRRIRPAGSPFFCGFWLGLLSPCLLLGAPAPGAPYQQRGEKRREQSDADWTQAQKPGPCQKKHQRKKTRSHATRTHAGKWLSTFFWRKGKGATVCGPHAGSGGVFRQKIASGVSA